MYTHEMMMKREQLRTDPLVESALTHMWARFDKVRGGEEAISQQTYTAMCRKLYLLFKIQQRDGYLEPADALSEIVRDWPHDTGGKDHMNRHDFDSAWFQLADIHTDCARDDGRSDDDRSGQLTTRQALIKAAGWSQV